MKPELSSLRSRLKQALESLYGVRLRSVYLFGSYARGDMDSESDLDVLIVLDRIDRYGQEVDRTGEVISSLSLDYGLSLSRVFVTENDWLESRLPFLQAVRSEAVPA
jgi:uncharacterized protein